jgi:prepilin-type N-terminal cleavage/methylation domain-containing protein
LIHRGFTLIELLVVITIVSVMISLLLPSLGSARAVARQSQCLANVKQHALATTIYAIDNRDKTPLHFQFSNSSYPGFARLLAGGTLNAYPVTVNYAGTDYTGQTSSALRCPEGLGKMDPYDDSTKAYLTGTYRTGWTGRVLVQVGADPRQMVINSQGEKVFTEYVLNGMGWYWSTLYSWEPVISKPVLFHNDMDEPKGHRLDDVVKASDTFVSADGGHADFGVAVTAWRHVGMAGSFSYVDGHAQSLKPGQVDGWVGSAPALMADARMNLRK